MVSYRVFINGGGMVAENARRLEAINSFTGRAFARFRMRALQTLTRPSRHLGTYSKTAGGTNPCALAPAVFGDNALDLVPGGN